MSGRSWQGGRRSARFVDALRRRSVGFAHTEGRRHERQGISRVGVRVLGVGGARSRGRGHGARPGRRRRQGADGGRARLPVARRRSRCCPRDSRPTSGATSGTSSCRAISTLDLEPGKYRLRIERGLEYLPVELDVDVPRSRPLPVRLRRWIDMNRAGWYSADMHVHRDPADIPLDPARRGPQLRAHHHDPRLEHRREPALEADRGSSRRSSSPAGSSRPTPRRSSASRAGRGPSSSSRGTCRSRSTDTSCIRRRSPTRARSTRWAGSSRATSCSGWTPSSTPPSGQIDVVELNCNHFLPRAGGHGPRALVALAARVRLPRERGVSPSG